MISRYAKTATRNSRRTRSGLMPSCSLQNASYRTIVTQSPQHCSSIHDDRSCFARHIGSSCHRPVAIRLNVMYSDVSSLLQFSGSVERHDTSRAMSNPGVLAAATGGRHEAPHEGTPCSPRLAEDHMALWISEHPEKWEHARIKAHNSLQRMCVGLKSASAR